MICVCVCIMKIQRSLREEGKYQKWSQNANKRYLLISELDQNVIYTLFVNISQNIHYNYLLIKKKHGLFLGLWNRQLGMSRNACCYQSAFFKCHVLLALSFAPHFTVFPINLRSHSQLNLSRVRAAANAACGNASPWPPLLLQWPCDIPNSRASPSPYCSPLVFVSKLNTN